MKTMPDFFLFLRHMFYKVKEVHRQNIWVGAKSAWQLGAIKGNSLVLGFRSEGRSRGRSEAATASGCLSTVVTSLRGSRPGLGHIRGLATQVPPQLKWEWRGVFLLTKSFPFHSLSSSTPSQSFSRMWVSPEAPPPLLPLSVLLTKPLICTLTYQLPAVCDPRAGPDLRAEVWAQGFCPLSGCLFLQSLDCYLK